MSRALVAFMSFFPSDSVPGADGLAKLSSWLLGSALAGPAFIAVAETADYDMIGASKSISGSISRMPGNVWLEGCVSEHIQTLCILR